MGMFIDETAELLQAPQWRTILIAAANDFQEGPHRHRITLHNPNLGPPLGTANTEAPSVEVSFCADSNRSLFPGFEDRRKSYCRVAAPGHAPVGRGRASASRCNKGSNHGSNQTPSRRIVAVAS